MALARAKRQLVFAVTLNNTGYAMVRQAREMVAAGELGELRAVHAAYIQDWLTLPIDAEGQKQAEWRTDPARAGQFGGARRHRCARLQSRAASSPGARPMPSPPTFHRRARAAPRRQCPCAGALDRGARGTLTASQASPGNYNDLSREVYGDKAGLEWKARRPRAAVHAAMASRRAPSVRGGHGSFAESRRVSRMPAAHPEGYIEGFANLYRDAVDVIRAHRAGDELDPARSRLVPDVGWRARRQVRRRCRRVPARPQEPGRRRGSCSEADADDGREGQISLLARMGELAPLFS